MRKIAVLILICSISLLGACSVSKRDNALGAKMSESVVGPSVPSAAESIGKQLDEQIIHRYAALSHAGSQNQRVARTRAKMVILGTVAANLNDLNASCPLSRQMSEEISSYMMKRGYRFQELRKGSYIRIHPTTGEMLLTRDVKNLEAPVGVGHAILAGTYVVGTNNIRFNMRLIHVSSNEVLAMASASVPISDDIAPLLFDYDVESNESRATGTNTRLQ